MAKKIITYNVNGIRAALNKGLMDWLSSCDADLVCLQETKAHPEQLDLSIFEDAGYHHYWQSAKTKKGYSGVAILTRTEPDHVEYGCNFQNNDEEGRVIRADFGENSVMSVYIPSGSSGDERQAIKMKWLGWFQKYINKLRKERENLIIAGDYNICHKPIDIHNPVSNKNSSGFLPEEREWLDKFVKNGFIDTFRHFNEDPHHYTWWSYRANARAKNLGWRIDYQMSTDSMRDKLKRAVILPEAKHSDHCPMLLEVEI